MHPCAGGQRAEGGQRRPCLERLVRHAQLREDPLGLLGHKRPRQHGDKPHAFGQHVHHIGKPAALRFILAQHPRLRQVDIFIAFADHLPDLRQRLRELQPVHLRLHGGGQRGAVRAQRLVHRGVNVRRPRGQRAVEIFFDHRHRAGHKVAQIIGKVGVHAGQEGLVGIIAVRAEGHFTQQVIAQRVRAVARHDGLRIDDVALGFAHFIVGEQQPAVGEDLLGQGQPQRVEHDGPIDGVEAHDLLTHQMHVRRPIFAEKPVVRRIVAQCGNIIGQRVDPHIHNVSGVKIHRHAPCEAGAAHAQILQAGLEEIVNHFVGAGGGLNEIGMGLDIVDQPILIFAHTEEIAFLLHGLDGRAAIRAAFHAVLLHHLRGRPERFARRAVQPLVGALINVALIVEAAENLLHGAHMAFVRGADEIVVFNLHQLPKLLGVGHNFIDILLGRYALLGRLALDLLSVLVRTGEEIGVVARQLLKARHRVRRHGGVGVPDVHVARRVIDGCGDVEGLFFAGFAHSLSLPSKYAAGK